MPVSTNQINDAVLVQRLKQRDKAALEELLRVHGAKIYGVALQFMRNDHDAQEVMQDALVAIWTKIQSFEGRSAFTSWLYRVTANAALMALRKQQKHKSDISMEAGDGNIPEIVLGLSDESMVPDRTAVRAELGTQVRQAIDQLPEPYRTAVLLRDVEEFDLNEIASSTGVSLAAVKSRLHRGRLAIRKALLPYLKGDGS